MRGISLNDSTIRSCALNPWIVGAIGAAFLLRVFRLDAAAIWLDETFTANWVIMPWGDMLSSALADNHLPLYFILVKAWTLVAGDSPWALRFVSVIFCCATVPIVAAIAFTLSGRSAAIWAAWLTAVSPFLVHHGQEARMYPLLAFLAAINLLLLARFITHKTQRLHVGYLLTNVAMLATHYYAVFVIAITFPILFVLARHRWRSWLPMLSLSVVCCIGPILVAKYLATPVAGGKYEGIDFVAIPGMIWGLLTGYALMPSSEEFHMLGLRAILPYLPFAAGVLGLTGIAIFSAFRTLPKPAWILLLGVLCGVLLGPLAVSLVFQISINPRYATAGAPAFLVVLAIGILSMRNTLRGQIMGYLLIILICYASIAHLADPGHGREDVIAATQWLDQNVSKDEEILYMSQEFVLLSNYHWPHRNFRLYPSLEKSVDRSNLKRVVDDLPLQGKQRVIYVIGRGWISDPDDLLESELHRRYRDCGGAKVRGIRILCLSPKPIVVGSPD